MSRRDFGKALGAVLAAAGFTPTLRAAVGAAQDAPVRLQGRVQWIAGSTLVVVLDAANPSVSVDLSQVSLDQYQGLAEGDPVAVTGTVTNDRDRVIATSVERLRP